MPSEDIMLLLNPVIITRGDLVSASFKHVDNYLITIDDVTI